MAFLGGPPNLSGTSLADERPGPQRAAQQDVPAIQACRSGPGHLEQEGWAQQAPEMAPHVVRPHGEKETRPDALAVEEVQQIRHSDAGAPQRIDIDSEADLDHRSPSALPTTSLRK